MIAILRRFYVLILKELSQLLKNPKTRITLLLPPAIQLVVLGYAATLDLKEVKFAVLDHAQTEASRQLSSAFSGASVFLEQAPLRSEKDLEERISTRQIKMGIIIPRDFDRSLDGHAIPQVMVILDGRNSTTAGLAIGYAQNVIDSFNRSYYQTRDPVKIKSRAWFNENYSAQYFMVPALLATIALLDLMLLTALSIAREREDGTFDQLLLTPYSSAELLAAKGASTIFVGLCQLSIGLLVARLWFQVPFRSSYLLLYLLFFSFLAASVGIGLLISVHCQDLQQAMLGAFLVAVPFAMLSGMATPVESMPDIFQKVTLINPIRYGIQALHSLFLEGAGLRELIPTLSILWGIGLSTYALAYLSFQHQRKN